MKLVLIIGDSAVGKMTVGQELMKITNIRLFHNHMMIEPVLEVFGEFHVPSIMKLREVIFTEYIKTENEGLIYTSMWAFDRKEDWDYIKSITDLFKSIDAPVYCVELIASKEIKLERNKTSNRLEYKKSKRDIKASEARMHKDNEKYRLVSNPGEIPFENYLRIENNDLSAQTVAGMIKTQFGL